MNGKETEILVIGAGLAGLIAAAKSAESGKKVILVAKGSGTLSVSSGCIDLWGYTLTDSKICSQPIKEIKQLVRSKPGHPYAKAVDVLEESLDFLQAILKENDNPYAACPDGNWVLPTALGTVRPTYLAPLSMAVPSLKKPKHILVVGFRELKDFYPEVFLRNLRKNIDLPVDCDLEAVQVSTGGYEINPSTLAGRLERKEVRRQVIEQIRSSIKSDSCVLFPPVLGERRNTKAASELAAELGCTVFEIADIPPSLPGVRLQQTLLHHLKSRGVEVISNSQITHAEIKDGKCLSVVAEGLYRQFSIKAESYVLATGSFFGGGLVASSDTVKERIFNLPVHTNDNWSRREFLDIAGQPFNEFGIQVNDKLQPVDEAGVIVAENLYAAGAVIAGANFAIEKSGNGIALVTGYKAGKLAGEAE